MQSRYDRGRCLVSRPEGFWGRCALWCMLIPGILLFYGFSLWWGTLNQDEGWYLYAGRMVAAGYVPYRDFAFTQGPLMAYVYAAAAPLLNWQGLLGGRLFTVILAWFALGLAVFFTRILARRNAQHPFWPSIFVLGFWGLNLYHVYFTTIVKTYALTAVLMLAGMMFLEQALGATAEQSQTSSRKRILCFSWLGGMLLAFAAGVRLSAAFLLPACWLPVLVHWIRLQRPRLLGVWLLGMLVGGTMGVLAVFVPFWVLSSDGLYFGLFAYHTGREVDSLFSLLVYKAGFVLRLMQAYWPLFVAALLMPWEMIWRSAKSLAVVADDRPLHVPIGVGFVVVTLLHVLSVFPYDDYQVFVMPLGMIALSLPLGRFVEGWHMPETVRLRWAAGLIVVLLCFGLSGGMLQGWLIGPRDLIWWPIREQSSLGQLREVGRIMREGQRRSEVDGKVITQDLYLAVESGYRVPRGMELGPFANFWGLSDEDAIRFRVLNVSLARDIVSEADAEWAACSGYGFAIEAPGIIPTPTSVRGALLGIIEERFVLIDRIEGFGQAATDLYLYRKAHP